jgi:serine/threonine protein kinase
MIVRQITFPEDFPVLAKDFVMGMLKRNPKERSTLKDLRNHQWLMMKPISKLDSAPSNHQQNHD